MPDGMDVEVDGRILLLRFARPERMNAITLEMLAVFAEQIDRFASSDDLRVLVLTGSDPAFCAGGDMQVLDEASGNPALVRQLAQLGHRVSSGLELVEKPVICAVNGVAAGAGVDLALACDLRIAAASASFVLTFTAIGLLPDMGATWRLPRLVGTGKAKELIMLGSRVGAEEAERIGLINRVVPDDSLLDAAMEWASHLTERRAPLALGAAKVLIDQAMSTDLTTALRKEQFAAAHLTRTSDFNEGVSAFLEKRRPRFHGR